MYNPWCILTLIIWRVKTQLAPSGSSLLLPCLLSLLSVAMFCIKKCPWCYQNGGNWVRLLLALNHHLVYQLCKRYAKFCEKIKYCWIFRWIVRNPSSRRSGWTNICLHHWHSVQEFEEVWQVLVRRRKPPDKVHRGAVGRDQEGVLVQGDVRQLRHRDQHPASVVRRARPVPQSTCTLQRAALHQPRSVEGTCLVQRGQPTHRHRPGTSRVSMYNVHVYQGGTCVSVTKDWKLFPPRPIFLPWFNTQGPCVQGSMCLRLQSISQGSRRGTAEKFWL